jgi:ATP phosphoribosyltransferase regulatory subunit HisZ
MAKQSVKGIVELMDLGAHLGARLWRAIRDKDEAEVQRLVDVWPEPSKSRVALIVEEERARLSAMEG